MKEDNGVSLEVSVRNFQALENVDLVIKGFTVVTGASNTGKSSLIRAISFCLYGDQGETYIRRGKEYAECSVTHTFPLSNKKIRYRKVSQSSTKEGFCTEFEIDGVVHTKLGRSRSISIETGFEPVSTTYESHKLNLSLQHEGLFLISSQGSTVAEVLQCVGRVNILTEASGYVKVDHSQETLKKKACLTLVEECQKRFQALASVPEISRSFSEVDSSFEKMVGVRKKNNKLLNLLQEFLGIKVVSLPKALTLFSPLTDLKILPLLRELQSIKLFTLPTHKGAKDFVDVEDRLKNILLLRELEKLQSSVLHCTVVPPDSMKSPFVSLVSDKKIPLLVELSNLQAFLSSHSTKNLKPLEESFRQTSLGEIPLYQELCMLQESLIDIQTRLIEAKESITKVEELKREMEVELGNCPTCGRSFDNVE